MSLATAGLSVATDAVQLDIRRTVKVYRAPTDEIIGQKLFIEFVGSQKMTMMFREQLKAQGYSVVETADEADAKFKFTGYFNIDGAGKEAVKGSLGELMEKSVAVQLPTSPDYKHENTNLTQIAVSGVAMGAISVTDVISWLGQQTGLAGRFNEALTGDPRGFCMHENCNKYRNRVFIIVTGETGRWTVEEVVQNEKIVLDVVIADALEKVLVPLIDLQKNKSVQVNPGGSQ